MACDLMGWNSIFVLNPYSEKWRERRKLFVQYFRPTDAVHVPRVYEFVHRLLLDLHETPKEVRALTRQYVQVIPRQLARTDVDIVQLQYGGLFVHLPRIWVFSTAPA